MRRGAALLLTALAGLVLAGPARAADYVAMGDSYASGDGIGTFMADGGTAPWTHNQDCKRSNTAWPKLIDPQVPGSFLFVACSGAKTNNITTSGQNGEPRQVDALDSGTDYVTIQIGGNDAGFVPALIDCGNPFGDCDGALDDAEAYIQNTLPAQLDAAYSAIRTAAPNALVVGVGYPRLFRGTGTCNTFFSEHEQQRANQLADLINQVTSARAGANGIFYVDPRSHFLSHAACDSIEWINGLSLGNIGTSYHPNQPGNTSGYAPIVQTEVLADHIPPVTTVGPGPANPTNQTGASFTLASDELGSSFKCRLDSIQESAFQSCTSPKTYSGLTAGSHTFEVRATDASGNVDPTPASRTWTVDLTPPGVSIDPGSGPNGTTSSTDAEFEFSTDPGASLACKLDADEFASCASPVPLSGLADGPHTFTVRATDQAGNAATASRSWTVDTAAPQATVNSGPASPTPSTDAEFEFSFDDPSSAGSCSLDGEDFEPCSSPHSYTGLDQGEHVFAVRGTDGVGNTGPEESYEWTVDSTASAVSIDSGPESLTNQTSASFAFTIDDPSAEVDCSIDGGAFAPCDTASSQDYTGLAPGPHIFTVRATDLASNEATDSHAWTIDTAVPTAEITDGPPAVDSSDSAELAFSSDDPEASFICRVDSIVGPFDPCTDPHALDDLDDGPHTFQVRALDQAGNLSPIATHAWTVDTASPTVSITDNPPPATNQTTAAFTFSSSQPGSSFRCRIDSTDPGEFEPCGGPGVNGSKSYSDLDPGAHSFDVVAVDPAGNEATADSHAWTIDTTAPTVNITGNPDVRSDQDSATFIYTASEPGPTFECRLDSGSFHSCPSPHLELNLPDGAHSFEVRAKDAVNNTGPASTYLWISDTENPIVNFDTGPANGSSTNQSAVAFGFHVNEEPDDPIECKLEGPGISSPQFGPCDAPAPDQDQTEGTFTRSGLVDGTYTLNLRAFDLVGHSSPPVSRSWTVDTAAPTVSIGSGPSGSVNTVSASFQFTASGGEAPRCSLDGAPAVNCSSATSQAYPVLSEGPHFFTVTSTDAAGNVGSATRNWSIDLTPPETSISSGPANPSGSGAASFEFGSSDLGASFQCALDGAIFTPCASPLSYSGLGEGDHTFRVRAVDEAGNIDLSAAAHSWRVTAAATNPPSTGTPQGDVGGVAQKKQCKRKRGSAKSRKCKRKK